MPNIKSTFIGGKMNKDFDERLTPKGEYTDALNVRIVSSDGSDIGALENVRGNRALTSFTLPNAKVIGALADDTNNLIYFFISSDTRDVLVEFNATTELAVEVLAATKATPTTASILNLNGDLVIDSIVKVINGEPNRDLLLWTDGVNPPRQINIERAKTYAVDGFNSQMISLIKRPPIFPPTVNLTNDPALPEGGLEDRFIAFGYRWRYIDGEYSALSPLSNYAFTPNAFDLDFENMENEGMVNQFNSAQIQFNTGTSDVTDIEVVYKESNSQVPFIIQSFNKGTEGWADNSTQSTQYTADRTYRALPESQYFRTFDNVPLTARAMELVGTRMMFGNYTEGYDMIDDQDNRVNFNYTPTIDNRDSTEIDLLLTANGTSNSFLLFFVVDTVPVPLGAGSTLNVSLEITDSGSTTQSPPIAITASYVLEESYGTVADLEASTDFTRFKNAIGRAVLTALDPQLTNIVSSNLPVSASQVVGGTAIRIDLADATYTLQGGGTETTDLAVQVPSTASIVIAQALRSVKSGSNYEVTMIYKDGDGRSTPALQESIRTLSVNPENSANQNVIQIELDHRPPAWAEYYTFAIKSNVRQYQTIYANIFYQDELFVWIKLDGANVNKVREGDNLIVKADLGGVTESLIRTRVLEVTRQEANFLSGNTNNLGAEIIEEAGLYMRLKPEGFDMNATEQSFQLYQGSSHLRYPNNLFTQPEFGSFDDTGTTYTPRIVEAGTRIRIFIRFEARGSIAYTATYDQTFIASQQYASVQAWFDAEVVDLGDFGTNFTRNGNGFGFSTQGDRFFVRAHRDGTASRSISSEVKFEFFNSDGIVIFETEPDLMQGDVFYEVPQIFEINSSREHQGNRQSQDYNLSLPARLELDFFNCYVQGNGAESYRFRDEFNTRFLNTDLRPTTTTLDEYRQIRRYADITYSEPYVGSSGVNGLNEFNLSLANFKDDIDKNYGSIQLMYFWNTDLIVFQEDKVSKVLAGKDLLVTASGESSVTNSTNVLGQQIAYKGEYGISRNPESFDFDGANLYWADAKRGSILRLGNNGITEISSYGMKDWFKDLFTESLYNKKLGVFDPFFDQYYVMANNDIVDPLGTASTREHTLSFDEGSNGWTSFHSWLPEWSVGMNNRLYSFFQGNVYVHNDNTVNYNTFYGVSYPSTITFNVNERPSTVKIHKALRLEGSDPWDTTVRSYLTDVNDFIESSVNDDEYVEREGMWYGYTRRDEDDTHLDAQSVYGLGIVTDIALTGITFNGGNAALTVGDAIYSGATQQLVGSILSVSDNVIVTTSSTGLNVGDFIYGRKPARIEGAEVRGYNFNINMSISKDSRLELFAVNTDYIDSFS